MAKKINTKRKSESAAAAITTLQYEDALKEYYGNNTELVKLGAEMDGHIQEILDQYDADVELLKGKQALLFAVIKGYCVANKESLIAEGARSFENLYAKIGFRTATPSLKAPKGMKWDDLTDKVKELLPEYIRTVEEVDKQSLIRDRDMEIVIAGLAEIGIKVSQEEKFFIDLKKVELEAA